MKKRISSIRKIFVTVLAAALISGMTVPAAAFAQEAETQEDPVIMEEENSETELQKAETPEEEEITDAETPEEEESTDTEKATETETEELTDTEDPTEPEDPEEENPAEPEDPEDGNPAEPKDPEEAVEVSLAIPEGYDPSRTVVAEIGQSAGSQTPAWTEITYQNINGGAVFKTDHSGLFVIAEEKQWKDIPASLEMTSKVDRLELTKVYPSGSRTSGALPASLKYSTSVPLTGDDYSVFIWGGVTVLAAAAVIAGIIIIIKRRK